MSWEKDIWLGNIMGKSCFVPNISGGNTDYAVPKQDEPAFYSVKIPVENIGESDKCINSGFKLIETNLSFCCVDAQGRKNGSVREALQDDEVRVKTIAEHSFLNSRFHLDPQIANEIANRIKTEWVGNYFQGKRGHWLLVSQTDSDVSGFLLALLKENGDIVIDLIAVAAEYRSRGNGRNLVNSLFELSRQHSGVVTVGTQASNVDSVNFYTSLGFRLANSHYTFHKHQ